MAVRFGIKTIPAMTTYAQMLDVWQEADELPVFEHAWNFDHFYPIMGADPKGPCLEGWTSLAGLAQATKRIRIGVMVTGNTYRHPAVLANMTATVDIISHGRLDCGLGAAWNEQEHVAYGIPFYTTGERIRRLAEACEVLMRLWTQEEATFEGKYYQLHNAWLNPKPVQQPHPPLVIGGAGEQMTLKIVAQYADIWNVLVPTPAEFQRKSAILDEHCVAIGRDPSTIERSMQFMVDPDHPETTRETVRQFIDAGVNHVILNIRPDQQRAGAATHVAREIAEPLKAIYG